MISDDDLSPQLAQAFADRHLSLAPSGRFLAEQEAADTATRDAEHATQASDWLRSQGLGDALPSPNDYDYTAMIRDAVYPTKDGAGRVPLPPKYWKPGRMIVGGMDLATGQRITSRAPLEDRILGLAVEEDESGGPDVGDVISTLHADDLAELSTRERRSLEAWMESHGVVLAAGPSKTMTDAGPVGQHTKPRVNEQTGTVGPIPRDNTHAAVGRLGEWVQTLADQLDKLGVTIPTPWGDVNPTLKDLTVGDIGRVLQDIADGFDPITGGNLATGGVGTYGLKPDALELLNAAPAAGVVVKGVTKGAKVLAPTAGDMARRGAEKVVDGAGGRAHVVPPDNRASATGAQPAMTPDAFRSSVFPVHKVQDSKKFEAIYRDMVKNGWTGRPILAIENDGAAFALTGSHRIAAAKKAGIDIPVIYVDETAAQTELRDGTFLFDNIGAGDDRVADMLREAGDARAADLMEMEFNP